MRFSASSLLITIFISTLLILILDHLLSHKKNYKLFRTDFLYILILVIVLRLFFPFELAFTQTIKFPLIMNPIIAFLQHEIYNNIQVYQLVIIIWILGILFNFIKWIQLIKKTRNIYKRIEKKSTLYHLNDYIDNFSGENYPILKSDLISSCMVMGFTKAILIPNISFSKKDISNILLHESQHIKNHDIYTKQIINLLVIIYWWFIPIYKLRNKIDLFLEIRVDNQVTKFFSKTETLNYMNTIIDVQNKIRENENKSEINLETTSLLIQDNAQILKYRINYLLDGMYKKKTNKLFMFIVFCLPLLTNSIIFESHFDTPKEEGIYEQSDIDEGHIIKHKDGTYELILKGESLGTIKNPNDEAFKNIPIIDEEEINK